MSFKLEFVLIKMKKLLILIKNLIRFLVLSFLLLSEE